MRSENDLEWFAVRIRFGQDSRVILALEDAGIRYFDPEFRRGHSASDGHGVTGSKVFPGHLFVAVDSGHAMLERSGAMPGILAVFSDEKGRPMCIGPDRIADLEAYCSAAGQDEMPTALRALDLLHDGERLEQFLDYCWTPSHAGFTGSDGSAISATV